ncbi:MAG: LLM class oxidoreductase [Pseudomonadota bacterium]
MPSNTAFATLNNGFNRVFQPGRLSVGLVVPIESYPNSPVPTMSRHIERVQLAEALNFAAVWLRDVPFNVPSFGDAGQTYDPFVYLGSLAANTERIALGVASIILPLRHPAHVAKAAATADVLSGGRLLLGVASGDRPEEYPALNADFANRGQRFRDAVEYIRQMAGDYPTVNNTYGRMLGIDMLPKPVASQLPLLVTGGSQQHPDWNAEHADGWMTYPRNVVAQAEIIRDWQARVQHVSRHPKPIMQPLYVDLLDDPNAPAESIHLGLRTGSQALLEHLKALEQIGVNHVALNLRFNHNDIEQAVADLAQQLLPAFPID